MKGTHPAIVEVTALGEFPFFEQKIQGIHSFSTIE